MSILNSEFTKLPFFGRPLNVLNAISAASTLPFDANHGGVSGITTNTTNENTLIPHAMDAINRQSF